MSNLILPLDPSQRHYGGYVEAMGRQYRVSITCPRGPGATVDLASFRCDPELLDLLESKGVWNTLRARLSQAGDLEGFMADLTDVLEKVLRTFPRRDMPPADFYARLVAEIDAVGWAHLVSMDDLLTSIQLRERDASGREHVFGVSIPSNYPRSPPCVRWTFLPISTSADGPHSILPVVSKDLSISPRFTLPCDFLSRSKVVSGGKLAEDRPGAVSGALEPYLALWNVLEDLDRHTWVLEPEKPSRSTTHRRVAVAAHCSLMLKIDPRAPSAVPEVRFLGSQAVIGPLRETFSKNLLRWDHARMLRANLEATLELKLPSPATSTKEDYSADCGICYSYRLQPPEGKTFRAGDRGQGIAGVGDAGSIPDRVCDNPRCRRPYHPSCLLSWLQGLPTSRVSFDTTFGQCPYCSVNISVKIVP